jgi:TRAP-type mannitol/chloroaromatic compound transport system substrate-binding protein
MMTGKRTRSGVVAAMLALACATGAAHPDTPAAPPDAATGATVSWRMQSAFASDLPGLGAPGLWLSDRLAAMTDGAIRIQFLEPGEAVAPFEILGAVSDGRIDAAYSWIGYGYDRVPAATLFAGVPFGMKPSGFIAWYHFHGGHEMLQEVYAAKGLDVHARLCGIVGPETAGWYREPIESLEDFEGLKIRFAGLGGEVMKRLGADVIMMPAGELIAALKDGTLDAAEFSLPVADKALGLDDVVKYTLFPGWHQQFTAQYLLVNGERWRALSAAERSSIASACMAATTYALAQSEARNGEALASFRENGVTAGQIPQPVLEELQSVTADVMAEEAARDADFKRVYESQQAFMEMYRAWDRRAYLPPGL